MRCIVSGCTAVCLGTGHRRGNISSMLGCREEYFPLKNNHYFLMTSKSQSILFWLNTQIIHTQKCSCYLRTHVGNKRFFLTFRYNYRNGGQRVGTRTTFYPLLLFEDRVTWTKLQQVIKHTGNSGAKKD